MYMLFLYYRCATFCGKNTNRYFGLLADVNWTIFLFCYFKGLKHETDLLPKVMQQIKRRSFSNLFECFSSVTRHTCKISWENVFESSKFATTAVAVVVVVKLEENCFCRKDNLIYQMQTNRNQIDHITDKPLSAFFKNSSLPLQCDQIWRHFPTWVKQHSIWQFCQGKCF